jgi:putative restriction endonuclease
MADDLPEFDAPVFKKLANNDTGQARGHQAGIVIPKDLDAYFPVLSGKASAQIPTVDKRVTAILRVPGKSDEIVSTRYQHQTWGGTRPPERRLTDRLTSLRDVAAADDYLIIERGLRDRDLFRLTLIKAGSDQYKELSRKIGARRWGALNKDDPPVKDQEIEVAEIDQTQHESKPLELFDNEAAITETKVQRIARNRAFQVRISEIYEKKCAICGFGLIHPVKGFEVEAAHIVPRSLRGADDARNGLALCRTHHWAFDHGLLGVKPNQKIFIPEPVLKIQANHSLAAHQDKSIRLPTEAQLKPSPDALKWHMETIVKGS